MPGFSRRTSLAREEASLSGRIGRREWCVACLLLVFSCVLVGGCHTTTYCDQRCQVNSELTQRMGTSLGPRMCPDETSIPPGVDLADGLTEDEAVAVAMWNNAAYQEVLTQLGISRAQLLDAGLLSDPQLTLFFPLGPKQLEFTIFQSIDFLWLRPVRVRAAELDLCQVSEQMVQNGLNLIRDVRSAHAQLTLAQSRVRLAEETLDLQRAINDLAQKRLAAGDISELETMNTQVDALQSEADLSRLKQDRDLAREQLRVLMGIALGHDEFVAIASEIDGLPEIAEADHVAQALAMRPDLRAAEIQVEAACERLELNELQFMSLEGGYDANARGIDGFESGPAVRMTIPIFNGNKGGIAIADAQLQQALRRYVTVRDQIALDVKQAQIQLQQAQENLRKVQEEIIPKLEESLELAQKSFLNGGSDYFIVLITTQRFLTARTQELQLRADIRRAIAELDRSVGHRVSRIVPAESDDLNSPELPPVPEPAELVTLDFEEPHK